jgi:hypothetical protein
MIFANLKAYGWMAATIAAGGLLLVQTFRLHGEQIAHQKLKTEVAQASLNRSETARTEETQTVSKESTHAADTLKNSDEFTTSQPVRDAMARADLARADRLRIDAERRAATYRAQASACTSASSDIADRLTAFDRQLVEGVAVVGELRAVITKRDSQVKLLRGQIDADRWLLGVGHQK